jgi:hypothetical protein
MVRLKSIYMKLTPKNNDVFWLTPHTRKDLINLGLEE